MNFTYDDDNVMWSVRKQMNQELMIHALKHEYQNIFYAAVDSATSHYELHMSTFMKQLILRDACNFCLWQEELSRTKKRNRMVCVKNGFKYEFYHHCVQCNRFFNENLPTSDWSSPRLSFVGLATGARAAPLRVLSSTPEPPSFRAAYLAICKDPTPLAALL